jgi:hypothetical protein
VHPGETFGHRLTHGHLALTGFLNRSAHVVDQHELCWVVLCARLTFSPFGDFAGHFDYFFLVFAELLFFVVCFSSLFNCLGPLFVDEISSLQIIDS